MSDKVTGLAQRKGVKVVEKNRTKAPQGVVDQIAENEKTNLALEREIGGEFQFNAGTRGGDPNLLSLARQRGLSPSGTGYQADSINKNTQALGDYIQQYLKGEGNIDDLLLAIQKEQQAKATATRMATRTAEGEGAKLAGKTDQEAGGGLYSIAKEDKAAAAREAERLYNDVDESLKVEGTHLVDRINEVAGGFDKFTERLSSFPSDAVERVKEVFGPLITQRAAQAPTITTAAVEPAGAGGGFIIRIGNKTLDDASGVPTWFKSEDQATKVAEAVNARAMEAAQAKQAAVTAQGPSKAITIGQLKRFRSQMGDVARNSKDPTLAYYARELKTAVNETLDIAAREGKATMGPLLEGQPVGQAISKEAAEIAKLQKATDYWRDEYLPKYRQGATGKVLKFDPAATGGRGTPDSSVGGMYFKADGTKGYVETADDFYRTFGDNQEAQSLIHDYAAYSFLQKARNHKTLELDSGNMAEWIYQHRTAIEKFGLQDKFKSIKSATEFAEQAAGAEAAFNKSALARTLNMDPDKAIAEALMTGTARKQSIARLKELADIARRNDDTGAALSGLKAGIGEYFQRNVETSVVDLVGNKKGSWDKVDKFVTAFRPAMEQSGLYSRAELQAFDNVHGVLKAMSRQSRANAEYSNSLTPEVLSRVGGAAVSAIFRRGSVYGVGKWLFEKAGVPFKEMVDEATAKAVFDPRWAELINRLAINTKRIGPEKAAEIATRRAAMLGQIATTTAKEKPETAKSGPN
jgi:hypothetical protein